MYTIALYGGLPEIAYLAPRGNFLAPRMADEDERPRRSGEGRDAATQEVAASRVSPNKSDLFVSGQPYGRGPRAAAGILPPGGGPDPSRQTQRFPETISRLRRAT